MSAISQKGLFYTLQHQVKKRAMWNLKIKAFIPFSLVFLHVLPSSLRLHEWRHPWPFWRSVKSKTTMRNTLKVLDCLGYCQRPAFSLCISQHYALNNNNLWKFLLNLLSKLQERIKKEKHSNLCAFRCLRKALGLKYFNIWVRNYLFLN